MPYENQFRHDMSIIKAAKRQCTIYSASYVARYWYPFKLRKASDNYPMRDRSCMELMIDSNIKDESISNAEIIADAVESEANKIIPKDFIGEPEATRQSLIEFEEIIETEYGSIKPTIIPVLQDDHISHLEKHLDFYSKYNYIALGGMKGWNPEVQVDRLKQTRELLGDHVHIHGFGMGCSLGLIKAIRENHNLIDSLDMASAEKMVKNGNATDWSFNQQQPEIPMPKGDEKSTVNAGFQKSVLIMLNYMLTDKVNEEHLEKLFYDEIDYARLKEIIANAEGRSMSEINWETIENSPAHLRNQAKSGQQHINNYGGN